MEDGKVVIGVDLNTKSFEEEISKVEDRLEQIDRILSNKDIVKSLDPDAIKKFRLEAEKLTNKLVDLRKKQNDLDNPPSNLMAWLKNFGKETQNNIKHISRMALAIFGIRSAYNLVRSAISTLSSENEQLATDVEYIRYAIASTLQPIIERIIQLVFTLMQYLNYIIHAWTGKNIFANANKGLNSAVKSAKELQKISAGFDKFQKLDANTSSGTGGGGVGPSFDLSKIQGNVPDWVKWIADNGRLVLDIIAGITTALIGMKVFGLDPLTALGIGAVVTGILIAVQSLLAYLQDPTWENFGGILTGIGIALMGLLGIFLGAPGVVIGAVVAIVGIITQHWEEIKTFLTDGLSNLGDFFYRWTGEVGLGIYSFFAGIVTSLINVFETLLNIVKGILDGIIQFIRGVFNGDLNQALNGIFNIFKSVYGGIARITGELISSVTYGLQMFASKTGDIVGQTFKNVINAVLSFIEGFINAPIRAINGLIDVVNSVPGVYVSPLQSIYLPRLAKGGIINLPGRGVNIGGAIGGEAGREGVIPLTDEQALEDIGNAIGKHIKVNVNFVAEIERRVLARVMKELNNEDTFARNGG